jgi:hypothetical protein
MCVLRCSGPAPSQRGRASTSTGRKLSLKRRIKVQFNQQMLNKRAGSRLHDGFNRHDDRDVRGSEAHTKSITYSLAPVPKALVRVTAQGESTSARLTAKYACNVRTSAFGRKTSLFSFMSSLETLGDLPKRLNIFDRICVSGKGVEIA